MVPIVNENDTVADDEIRFGDNDRIAALVANMVRADVLVLLTDTAGLFTADPRLDAEASLIEEVAAVDEALESPRSAAPVRRGSGGMASKLAAAKIASWSGCARGHRRRRRARGGHRCARRPVRRHGRDSASRPAPSRKLWIAFAVGAAGRVVVDDGARRALVSAGPLAARSRRARASRARSRRTSAVEVVDESRAAVFAKGLVTMDATLGTCGRRPPDRRTSRPAPPPR